MEYTEFRDKFSGRIFLIGNGPSLSSLTQQQIEALNKEYLFMGSRYFDWEGATLNPSFYLQTERRQANVWLDNGWHKKASASIARFWVEWQPAPEGWVAIPRPPSNAHDVLNYGLFGGLEGVCKDGVDNPHLHHGKITPLGMVQIAKYMGFGEFYTIGVDGTLIGEIWDVNRKRNMHAPGIEQQYMGMAKAVITDCTVGGMHAKERGGQLTYKPLDEVLGLSDAVQPE